MKKLKFPIMKRPSPPAKCLSMDDYVRFVNLNLKYTINREAYKKRKKLLAVNVPFSIF